MVERLEIEPPHWVFNWLEENHVESGAAARRLLPKYKVLDSLRARAAEFVSERSKPIPSPTSIVAGAGIDLSSGGMICSSPLCMRKQVDNLMKHVWHYFDAIVVDDVLTPLLLNDWTGTKKDLIDTIAAHLEPLIYLKEIGAVELTRFSPKGLCEHWREHAQEYQLNKVLESEQEVIDYILQTGEFFYRRRSGSRFCWLTHPDLPSSAALPVGDLSDEAIKRQLAQLAYTSTVRYLAADVGAARAHGLPLGSILPLEARFLRISGPPSVEDVLFELRLPVLEHLPTRELISIRDHEADAFNVFRDALRKAVAERVKLPDTGSAAAVAEQIRMEVIEPALDGIRLRLSRAEASLTKKVGVGVFLGALATGCGLLLGLAPALAASAGIGTAVTATGTAAAKHIDEKSEAELDGMYFLWKASEHAH